MMRASALGVITGIVLAVPARADEPQAQFIEQPAPGTKPSQDSPPPPRGDEPPPAQYIEKAPPGTQPKHDEPVPERLLPESGAGLLGVEGGLRFAFPEQLVKGIEISSHSVGPALIVPFLYQVDRGWAVLIEIGYGVDKLSLAGTSTVGGGTLESQTVTIQLGTQWTPNLGWSRVQPVLGIGFGYYLSSLSSTGIASGLVTSESNTTGVFLSVGARIALTERIGVLVEDRYALASTSAGAELGNISVGGNTTAVGLYVLWKE